MKVYLSGALKNKSSREIHGWRNTAKRLLAPITTINPADNLYKRAPATKAVAKRMVEKDKADIDKCDVLLVFFDQPSVGTSMEILYAWERKKKVIVVNAPGTQLSPWMIYHAYKIVVSLDAACAAIKRLDANS